jgi:hypothetical protein
VLKGTGAADDATARDGTLDGRLAIA